ncbi:YkgJ family cysteine cluster protein [Megasphaera sp. DISK 18]|uniref:YkgJ family cysteine cluster protein n=1 Tax=Megasphaera sp. DISK 18 TaxID=1776081 RepID=UPI0008071B81|nr:YkgJ family cysteine cluster protein [Megasphaera sp. DISK 18]OBZ33638.1 hypothetical protein A0U42_05575 [Megasphaera sp. DISK 18]
MAARMNFPCIRCGECCRHAGEVPQLASSTDADGVCLYLDKRTNRCTIYATRPKVCNVSYMYQHYFKDPMTEREFIQKNLQVCCHLNKAAGKIDNVETIEKILETFDS